MGPGPPLDGNRCIQKGLPGRVRRYLHRGKLRCRRWMVGAMIPRTRELLTHVRQLSQLSTDDPAARARVRRCKRLLKVCPEKPISRALYHSVGLCGVMRTPQGDLHGLCVAPLVDKAAGRRST